MTEQTGNNVCFEAMLCSDSGRSWFDSDAYPGSENLREFAPPVGRGVQAARLLQSLCFSVHHIGTFSISAEGPREQWEQVFGTKVELRSQPLNEAYPQLGEVQYWSHIANVPFTIPDQLKGLIERAYPQRPPTFFESPLPPRVTYHHLRVPDDVAMLLRSTPVHAMGVTGKGVLVAMSDTGFYKHPFYAWHGYSYRATLSPDATEVDKDEYGHGTAQAANIFAAAPDIDFIGIKYRYSLSPNSSNMTLVFKTASDLYPAVMNNSWGWPISPGATSLPNQFRALEAAIIEAVNLRGITVCFSAGNNGMFSFPGMMPDVIAVGGVYAYEDLAGEDFKLEASNLASSFDSPIYPGRHVPDVCGLVGMDPFPGTYIMLPVEPGDLIDLFCSGGAFLAQDETGANDGWAAMSGTSAASAQVAGVCALLKQVQPGLSPSLVKAILRASARDVKTGHSANGQPAGDGYDGATGAGLVDAYSAYRLARSMSPRNLHTLPPPL
jgi:serine protease AprX